MADWTPKSATPADTGTWMPQSARRVIAEHTRRPPGLLQQVAQSGVQNLPVMAGMAGGLLGAPAGPLGAVGGAGLGGMAGQAAKLALSPLVGLSDVTQPPPVGQQLQSLLGAGVGQAGMEAGGAALGAGAQALGRAAMANALKVSGPLRQRFPGLNFAQTAIEQVLPIGRLPFRPGATQTLEGGAGKAQQLVRQSAAVEKQLRTAAGQNGVMYDVQRALVQPRIDEINDLRIAANRPVLQPNEEARIARGVQNTVKQAIADRTGGAVSHPAVQLTPEELHWVEQYAQKNARQTFTNATTGQTQASVDQTMASVARNARQSLVAPGLIPGLAEQSAQTQALRGLNQAVRAREYGVPGQNVMERVGERAASYGTLAALGGGAGYYSGNSPEERVIHGLIGAGLGAGLGSPQAMSLAALGLNNPFFLQMLRQAPRAVGAVAQ